MSRMSTQELTMLAHSIPHLRLESSSPIPSDDGSRTAEADQGHDPVSAAFASVVSTRGGKQTAAMVGGSDVDEDDGAEMYAIEEAPLSETTLDHLKRAVSELRFRISSPHASSQVLTPPELLTAM